MANTSNYYQLYIEAVLKLAQTIVIKSTETASALNKYVTDYYGSTAFDSLNPKSWKYYMNISGQYHPTDTMMYVVSLDTVETISFTIENLKIHRATAKGYAYGTRQYAELVAKYPAQEMLILGILYPVDIDYAVASPDGKILGYPPGLIEGNEYSLVSNLQGWIDGYKARWSNQQFGISDELYPTASLGIMYLNLVPAILNFRLEKCKTNEAHSFHVNQYLASHGFLDAYTRQLTLKQSMFLYRNIAYIERNAGKTDTFEWLVEHIMSERFLPIAEYSARHDLKNQPEEVYPTIRFRKNPLNLGYSPNAEDVVSLSAMLDKEDGMARDNPIYKSQYLATVKERMENSPSNVIATKVVESSVVDRGDYTPYTLKDILINHWLYLSTNGIYTAYVGVINPRSGERIPFTVKEAFTFCWYAFCKSVGVVLDEVPELLAKRVQRIPTPSVDQLMSVVNEKLIPRSVAEFALELQPQIVGLVSTESFYNTCHDIYVSAQRQRGVVAFQEHKDARAQAHAMISQIYSDNICRTEPEGESYTNWFAARNISIDDIADADLAVMYAELVKEATGMSLTSTTSLRELQKAMIGLLTQLSSYSIQIIGQINKEGLRPTDWPSTRVGNIVGEQKAHVYSDDMGAWLKGTDTKLSRKVDYEIAIIGHNSFTEFKQTQAVKVELPDLVRKGNRNDEIRVHVGVVGTGFHVELPDLPVSNDIVVVPGIDRFLALTDAEQKSLKDVYGSTISVIAPPVVDSPNMYVLKGYSDPGYTE